MSLTMLLLFGSFWFLASVGLGVLAGRVIHQGQAEPPRREPLRFAARRRELQAGVGRQAS
jgi:hypothetical protein